MSECHMERVIRSFVLERMAEDVELSLNKDICIRHVKKKGNILLATFWANILQHPLNFPPSTYHYHQHKTPDGKGDLLRLKCHSQDIVFMIDMATGKLIIKGGFVYEWFKNNFLQLLINFDGSFVPENIPNKVMAKQVQSEEQRLPKQTTTDTEEYLLMLSRKHTLDIPRKLEHRIESRAEELINGMEDITVSNVGIWEDKVLEDAIIGLSMCSVRDGFSFVYRAWKSLLNRWFTADHTQVYIVTPTLDAKRLKDIIDIFLLSRNKANIAAFYVRRQCEDFDPKAFVTMKRDAILEYDAKFHPVIDYRIFRQISHPWKTFNTSFIAGVKDGKAEVMITSARFTGKHFTTDNMETVCMQNMTKDNFLKQFIEPIAGDIIMVS